jgi:hypothetical protein
MRLQRIYSSKLYVTSSRKDRIHAAINDPLNLELVQQLEEYLDDSSQVKLEEAKEYQDSLTSPTENAEEISDVNVEEDENFDMESDDSNVFSRFASGPSSAPSGDSNFSDIDDSNFNDIPDSPEAPTSEPAEAPSAPSNTDVEESIQLDSKTNITAAITVDNILDESDIIKSSLNSRQDTCGVQRISVVDDDELWIYYKDEVNIGDIMINIIEFLNGSGYTYLTFSRLARSNNAIVFDISFNENEPIKSIEEIQSVE